MGIRCSFHDWRGQENIISYEFVVIDSSPALRDGSFVPLDLSCSHHYETAVNPPGSLQQETSDRCSGVEKLEPKISIKKTKCCLFWDQLHPHLLAVVMTCKAFQLEILLMRR